MLANVLTHLRYKLIFLICPKTNALVIYYLNDCMYVQEAGSGFIMLYGRHIILAYFASLMDASATIECKKQPARGSAFCNRITLVFTL